MSTVTLPETRQAMDLLRRINCPTIKVEKDIVMDTNYIRAILPNDWTADQVRQHYSNTEKAFKK